MNGQGCRPVAGSIDAEALGGLQATDFASLDALAIRLICLDSRFAAPLRQMGRVYGERIAADRAEPQVSSEKALSLMITACGLAGVVDSRFLVRNADEVWLEITGCAEALGWQVLLVERPVCGFNAGLFEGFLCGITGHAWNVEEIACLGLGNPSCEFSICRKRAPGASDSERI